MARGQTTVPQMLQANHPWQHNLPQMVLGPILGGPSVALRVSDLVQVNYTFIESILYVLMAPIDCSWPVATDGPS